MITYKLEHYVQDDIVEVSNYPRPTFGTSVFFGFPRKERCALFEEVSKKGILFGSYDSCGDSTIEEFANFLENIQRKFFNALFRYKKKEYSNCVFNYLTGVTYLLERDNKEYKSYCFLTTKENRDGNIINKDYGIILIPVYINTAEKFIDYFTDKFKKRSLEENKLYQEFFENIKIKSLEELEEILSGI